MEEEILPHILTVTPLFGGHLPFGNYYHDRIGNISLTTRSQRSFDSLFVDDIWPGSIYIADYLNKYPFLCYSKRILELGAGAALPSMVAGKLFCQYLVISDYPKKDILDNIQQVVEKNNLTNIPYSIIGYIWGDDIQPLIAPLSSQPSLSQPLTDMNSSPSSNDSMLFDLIILAEVLWKDTYPQHRYVLVVPTPLFLSFLSLC